MQGDRTDFAIAGSAEDAGGGVGDDTVVEVGEGGQGAALLLVLGDLRHAPLGQGRVTHHLRPIHHLHLTGQAWGEGGGGGGAERWRREEGGVERGRREGWRGLGKRKVG